MGLPFVAGRQPEISQTRSVWSVALEKSVLKGRRNAGLRPVKSFLPRPEIKSSPQNRSFGFAKAVPGKPFYITDESNLRTWQATVKTDGSLADFRLFTEQGGESVTADARGNVYLAAGQICVYDPAGKVIDTLEVPGRPTQLLFGGPDGKTLFIAARTSLYAVRVQ